MTQGCVNDNRTAKLDTSSKSYVWGKVVPTLVSIVNNKKQDLNIVSDEWIVLFWMWSCHTANQNEKHDSCALDHTFYELPL